MGVTTGIISGAVVGGVGGWSTDFCIARQTGANIGYAGTVLGGLGGAAAGGVAGHYTPEAIVIRRRFD